FMRDSLRWSKVQLSGRSTLFKNITLNYSSTWDPYILDSTGKKNLNQYEWKVNRRPLRLDNTNWNLSLNWNLSFKSKGKAGKPPMNPNDPEYQDYLLHPDNYIDFDIPWRLNFAYTLNYTANHKYPFYKEEVTRTIVQTLNVSGDISLAPRWKIGFSMGYDFENNKIPQDSLNVYRDLHCWEMRFNWIPIGYLKSWNFQINVKSSMLQDLKLTKKKDFRDR
ncbi:MAG TPA: LPS-assembly protein LptD, partial [Bacteroidales bacterium]|nr:LPS-assembly protein LptD [Bacteroidales bacterium]